MNLYTEEVLRTYAGEDTLKDKLTLSALGLAGEAGEVIDLIKKWSFQGHPIDQDDLLSEIGDVLWYITLLCSVYGWTLDDAIAVNIEKLRKRYPGDFEAARSINREEGA
jgi:NTP pyrophosphatase (non-canonical NTP hydrolase)